MFYAQFSTCSNPHADPCSNPIPWDPLGSPYMKCNDDHHNDNQHNNNGHNHNHNNSSNNNSTNDHNNNNVNHES